MKYDCIASFGCSFINGSAIEDIDGNFLGDEYRVSNLLSKHFNIPEVCYAQPGFGNESIFRSIYKFYKETKYKNPFILIGLSGITRKEVYSIWQDRFYDLHLFQNWDKHTRELADLTKKITTENYDAEKFKEYIKTWEKYFFDLNSEQEKLEWQMLFLDGFLKSKNINYVVFNSLENNINNIKNKLQYLSFNVNKEIKFKDLGEIEDCWYHKLRIDHYLKISKDFNDTTLRSGSPPFGRYFSKGHPSPGANKDLLKLILTYIDENYS
jgi:hypothetical protein